MTTKRVWIGRIMTALAVLPYFPSAIMKFMAGPEVLLGVNHLGWQASSLTMLGTLELLCTVVYLIPRTAVLGAILLTGYLGGAISTHLRLGEPVFMQITLGLLTWGALTLREPRLRSLLPLRR